MYPVLFEIFGRKIHSFGLMMVIGFLLAIQLARALARRSKLDPEIFTNVAMIGLIFGVIGARLSHVLENFNAYSNFEHGRTLWDNVWDAVNITSGGLTFYGGFLLGFPACLIYGWHKRVPLRLGMDIAAPCLMVGLAIGRIGCFMNGCCYGRECEADYPAAVTYPHGSYAWEQQAHDRLLPRDVELRSLPVHPAQLYSTFNSLLAAACLVAFFTIASGTGRVFALMLVMEGASRYLLETLRAEPHDYFGFSLSELLGLFLVLAGLAMGAVMWRWNRQVAQPA